TCSSPLAGRPTAHKLSAIRTRFPLRSCCPIASCYHGEAACVHLSMPKLWETAHCGGNLQGGIRVRVLSLREDDPRKRTACSREGRGRRPDGATDRRSNHRTSARRLGY